MLHNNHIIKTLSNTIFAMALISLILPTNISAMFQNSTETKSVKGHSTNATTDNVPTEKPPFK